MIHFWAMTQDSKMTTMEDFWIRKGTLVTKEEYTSQITSQINPSWNMRKIPSLSEVQHILASEQHHAPRTLAFAIQQEDTFVDEEQYRELFLKNYTKTNNLSHSAALIGVSAAAIRKRRKKDKIFDRLCVQAEEQYADTVKSIFQELALSGTEKTTFDRNGSVMSIEKVIYPRLLELEMKRVDPTYNEKKEIAHSVSGGVLVAPSEVSVEQWSKKYNDDNTDEVSIGLYEQETQQEMIEINPRTSL